MISRERMKIKTIHYKRQIYSRSGKNLFCCYQEDFCNKKGENPLKQIALLGTGGTISALGENELDYKDYATGSLSLEEMVGQIPMLASLAHYSVEQISNRSSCDLDASDWLRMKERIDYYLQQKEVDGVVITHGTSTLEETAYFLHLTMNTDKPIILVGAQRPFNVIGTDAISNLHHAIRVAIAPESRGKGVLVVLNDQISSAREATKADTYRLHTFVPSPSGYLGMVDPDQTVQYYRHPVRKHTSHSEFATQTLTELPQVAIVYSYSGASGDLIRFLTQSKEYEGIVVAGTGAGRVTTDEEEALAYAAKQGVTVVLSSRVGNGRVVPIEKYARYPFVTADNLLPQKARILLMLALTRTNDPAVIQQYFHEY